VSLTRYLQDSFIRSAPAGWRGRAEVELLDREWAAILGFRPRADVLLERLDGTRRLWVEFEVSRADPAANHMKFAAAHLHAPQRPADAFLSMTSSHVATGRANLGASSVLVMRALGMSAFQTVLLPRVSPEEIKRLNHAGLRDVEEAGIPVVAELERALCVTDAQFTTRSHRIHFAGNLLEVRLNVLRWNREVSESLSSARWGQRTITYFVYDPLTRLFAPAKFCAFLPVPQQPAVSLSTGTAFNQGMSIEIYASLEQTESRFDGAVARDHLERRLGMALVQVAEGGRFAAYFDRWLETHRQLVRVHPRGPWFLAPTT
jgi:hypothetical protein